MTIEEFQESSEQLLKKTKLQVKRWVIPYSKEIKILVIMPKFYQKDSTIWFKVKMQLLTNRSCHYFFKK